MRDGDGRFRLGARLVGWGAAAGAALALVEPARAVLQRLSADTGESAQLYVREGDQRVCVATHERPTGLRDTVPLGAVMPLTKGSGGRVLLAWADDRDRFDVDPARARRGARRAGWAATVGEREAGVASVSAPVRVGEHVVAALGVSGPAERLGPDPGAAVRRRRCSRRPPTWPALAARPSPRRNGDETIGSYVARMNVELVRWPSDPQRLAGLRDRGVPRLLLVSEGAEPPDPDRLSRRLGRGRRVGVGARRPPARARRPGPVRTARVPRSTTTACCATTTRGCRCRRSSSRSPGRCSTGSVRWSPRDVLASRAWPDGAPTRNALDVHVLRLRRRLAPLGLEIRTVRSRGYLLQELRQLNGRTATTVTPSSRFGP